MQCSKARSQIGKCAGARATSPRNSEEEAMFIMDMPPVPPSERPVLLVQARSNANANVVMQDLTPFVFAVRFDRSFET
ncbi:MAG: hypothetical protein A3G79_00390 [Gallionellales bacterium RIFCSPLOWO2_12_FULL_57_18]|nr:MAG: hypothetical protein A3G79_00390 [Gallionellales bacterium RIFCSPLOWO2_12_FULL_57_18]OGS96512.1 MAG: hypothetical protein A3H31_08675 [Gallionellales bacterium RIFCSPLOWO2_02_FULL_57_47]OGT10318.1 MAG: hypothetical protein A3J49_09420 [Gallionellales bacterium RIFCSPHIGHO2_02_FULL_57_16]